jgi:hypothetical protein
MRKFRLLLATLLAVIFSVVGAASASAYLHVYNAQNYASGHVWRTFCNSSYAYCPRFPNETGWYQRISSNEVRVEIHVTKYGYGSCYRVFDVRGNDGSEYISTAGSAPYYACF